MADYLPYTERVGVDNAFGWLHLPDGRRVLAESVVFVRGTGIVVDLESGLRRRAPADGSCHWQPLEPAQACGIVAIPEPELQEGTRRVDPYHVDRWRCPLFCALVELIHERTLPCAYSVIAHLDGHWAEREFLFATDENPERSPSASPSALAMAQTPSRPSAPNSPPTPASKANPMRCSTCWTPPAGSRPSRTCPPASRSKPPASPPTAARRPPSRPTANSPSSDASPIERSRLC